MEDALFADICRRLRDNVAAGHPEQADTILRVEAAAYRDAEQFQRELQLFFLQTPLLVALTCDVPEPGDFITHTIVGRPLLIVRGDDGQSDTKPPPHLPPALQRP